MKSLPHFREDVKSMKLWRSRRKKKNKRKRSQRLGGRAVGMSQFQVDHLPVAELHFHVRLVPCVCVCSLYGIQAFKWEQKRTSRYDAKLWILLFQTANNKLIQFTLFFLNSISKHTCLIGLFRKQFNYLTFLI